MTVSLILRNWWSATEAGIRIKPTPDATLAQLEARYGIALPPDFREYLSQIAPETENWDAEDGNWWPVERIKNIPEEYEHPVSAALAKNAAEHLVFLDYSIWSWAWAISCAADKTYGKIALIGGRPDGYYVADSFEEFIKLYTTDWLSVSQVPRS